jgi:hypothetical protein
LSKYTPEIAESIAESVGKGTPIVFAAEAHFVHRNTVHAWMRNKSAFRALVEAKKAQFIEENLQFINKARPTNWQAASWQLERQYPEYYALRLPDKGLNAPITINLIIPPGTAVKDNIDKWADVVEIEAQDVKQLTSEPEISGD